MILSCSGRMMYIEWAKDVSCHLAENHEEEIKRYI